jgi:hypothetical protein
LDKNVLTATRTIVGELVKDELTELMGGDVAGINSSRHQQLF